MTALEPVWAGPLSPEALGELEAFHSLSVDVVRRRGIPTPWPVKALKPEDWAALNAQYREAFQALPKHDGLKPLPPVPDFANGRKHGLDTRERFRLATIREAAGKARRAGT